MNIDEQLKLILKFGEGAPFLSFANADGKRWLMPVRHMRTAMNLYQPSGAKGKLVKRYLPWLYWNPVALRVLRAERMRLSLSDKFRLLLERTFGERDLEFAVFCGTPSVHQKITLQVSRGNRILGYVKVTESTEIYGIFEHEKKILDTLHDQGVANVPQCLYCGTLDCGAHVFIQTTIKTAHSKVVHEWTELHSRFLDMLALRTQKRLDFGDTDFCHDLDNLENRLHLLDDVNPLKKAITEVRSRYTDKEVTFSAYQADFTPWNMFVEKGDLFVFDWEYARLSYPPRLDYFHFKIQTAIFEEHLPAHKIYDRFTAEADTLNRLYSDSEFSFKCYLLAIILLYVSREKEAITNTTRERISFWTELLKLLEN